MNTLDLINTCELVPSEDVTHRLLCICQSLHERLERLEYKPKVLAPVQTLTCDQLIECNAIERLTLLSYAVGMLEQAGDNKLADLCEYHDFLLKRRARIGLLD